MSGVSQLSEFGPASLASSTSAGIAVVSNPGVDAAIQTMPPSAHPRARSSGVSAAAVILAIAAGGGAAYFAMSRSLLRSGHAGYSEAPVPAQEAPRPVVPATTAAAVAAAAPSAQQPAVPDPSERVVDIQLEGEESAAPGGSAKTTKGVARHHAPAPVAAKGKPAAQAPEAPTAPSKPAAPAKPSGPGAFVSPFRDPDF
jgi:hypothetical protein